MSLRKRVAELYGSWNSLGYKIDKEDHQFFAIIFLETTNCQICDLSFFKERDRTLLYDFDIEEVVSIVCKKCHYNFSHNNNYNGTLFNL